MVLFYIPGTKDFMNKLLIKSDFDGLLVSEAVITTFNTFQIDGRLHPDFYAGDEEKKAGLEGREYSYWSEVRPICLKLIKGKYTPLNFSFVFRLPDDEAGVLAAACPRGISASDIAGLFLNVRYGSFGLRVTTGISLKIFTADKSLEHAWDEYAARFLDGLGITYERL